MHKEDLQLCERILATCQQQRWYGGDESNTRRFSERDHRYDEFINTEGKSIVIDNDPDDHPRKLGFAYAPATEEQLQTTEQTLGFSLPPFLRLLYSQLANGGFGPGYGLLGAIGGFEEAGNIVDMYQYHAARGKLIDLEDYGYTSDSAEATLELPDTVWPRYMLYLCDWDDGDVSCADCMTGQVFLVHLGHKFHRYVLEKQATSLQEWWERWIVEQSRASYRQQKVAEKLQTSEGELSLDDTFDPFVDNDPFLE